MGLEDAAIGAIEPGDQQDRVSDGQAGQGPGKGRIDFEPRVGRAFVTLTRRVLEVAEGRADPPDRGQRAERGRVVGQMATVSVEV
jgi:hypothetical protein